MSQKLLEEDIMEMVMDHYDNPRNYGQLEDADVVQHGGNPGCGDTITIYIKIDKNGVVERASFDGDGCIISQATCSLITEHIKGMSVSEVKKLDIEFLKSLIGKDIIIRRPKCSKLALETIIYGLKDYNRV